MTIKTRLVVPSAALAVALALTGCGDSEPSSADQTPGAAQSSTDPGAQPGADETVRVGEEDGDATVENQDGTSTGNGSLPEGFPTNEIPIAAGQLVGGSKGEAGGPYSYTVLIQVPGTSPAQVMKGITGQLTRVGFKAEPGPTTDVISTAVFKTTKYDVGVNVIRAEAKTTVTYVVVKK